MNLKYCFQVANSMFTILIEDGDIDKVLKPLQPCISGEFVEVWLGLSTIKVGKSYMFCKL